MTIHHIISDDWSTNVIVKELGILYNSFRSNLPIPLDELEIQYADYAVWQRNWLQGDLLKSHYQQEVRILDITTGEWITNQSEVSATELLDRGFNASLAAYQCNCIVLSLKDKKVKHRLRQVSQEGVASSREDTFGSLL